MNDNRIASNDDPAHQQLISREQQIDFMQNAPSRMQELVKAIVASAKIQGILNKHNRSR